MTKYKSDNVIQSLTNAMHGLRLAFFSQRNFVIEIVLAIIAVILGVILRFNLTDICIILVISSIVLICELLNSVIEFTLDAVYKNSYSRLVEMAKDISAGMVLLACMFSSIIGTLLFLKYIFKYSI